MIIADTKDINLIKSVLCHPEIYKRIGNDEAPPAEQFEPPLNVRYIAGFVNHAIIGLMIYINRPDGILCHFQVLPQYREKYANKFARMALSFGGAKNAIIYAEIPKCCIDALIFALNLGFKIIGSTKKDRKLNGILHKVVILRLNNGICQ